MISLKNGINQWAFVIETRCVLWQVGADRLNNIKKLESNAQDYAGRSLGAGRAIRVGRVFSEEPDMEVGRLAWSWILTAEKLNCLENSATGRAWS